jgi:acetylornithine deacetylase/succinyl-diaminopimelate desuccinylase-like protein
MIPAAAPSRVHDDAAWSAAVDDTIATLRDLIRIPSVNPPAPDAPDMELVAARAIAEVLAAAGLEPEVIEPVAGRGSVHARLLGDGTGGEPLLLLSHLDVVPAPTEHWSHDPFSGDVAGGYVYGRGAVDMKAMVAMELGVVRLLAAEASAAGIDPARDPVPGLRRDVLFTSTADEEAGGFAGAKWIADHRPEWLQGAGGLNIASP